MRLRLPDVKLYTWAALTLLSALVFIKLLRWHAASSESERLAVVGEICIVAPATPYDPSWGIGLHAPRTVPIDARCPVCGMYPARARDWAAQVIFSNGDTQFFDSPLTLFIYLQDPGRYSIGRRASEIAVSYVSDTAGGKWIKASDAFYVSGSSAMGPMRAGNLPAFSSMTAAQRFADSRGGVILQANKISPQQLQNLNGARRHKHTEPAR